MKNSSKICSPEGWKTAIARNFEEIEAIRPVWEEMQAKEACPVINADIDRFISVIKASSGGVQPYVMVFRQNGEPVAMIISRMEKHQLKLRLGYKTLFSPTLKCLSVVCGGILGEQTNDVCTTLIQKLMNTLTCGEVDVVCMNHVATDSLVYRLARKLPNLLYRTNFPKIDHHWSMEIPQNIGLLYKSFAPKTRNTLRRKTKKLEREFADQIRIVTYCSEDKLGEAISAASDISSCTYHEALDAGFVNNVQTRDLMISAASHGWLRMSVLYIKGEPCSFQLGLQYKKTYFLEQLGFNPQWKQWNVGTVLFLKVLEDLCHDPSVKILNFGLGDAQYKRSYGDKQWEEACAYIFAPRLYPIFINALRTFMMGLNLGLNYAFQKFGSVGWIKRNWRNMLQAKRSESTPSTRR